MSEKRSGHHSLVAVLMAMLLGWSAGTSADESFWPGLPLSSSRSAAVDRDVPLSSSYRAITVSGLKNDVAYTCNVVATNNNGSGGAATASSTITPEATGLPIWLLY